MLELWIAVSTVCFWRGTYLTPDMAKFTVMTSTPFCYQQVSISTIQSTAKKGETVYRVMPDGHVAIPRKVWDEVWSKYYWGKPTVLKDETFEKLLDEVEKETVQERPKYSHVHRWIKDETPVIRESCYCGKHRRKVTTEKWIEE